MPCWRMTRKLQRGFIRGKGKKKGGLVRERGMGEEEGIPISNGIYVVCKDGPSNMESKKFIYKESLTRLVKIAFHQATAIYPSLSFRVVSVVQAS